MGNNPLNGIDPTGLCFPVCLAVGWAVAEVGFSLWDAYDAYNAFTDGCAGGATKAMAGGFFLLGLFAPGGLGAFDNAVSGGRRVAHLGDDVVRQVDDAVERAARGKIRFPGHDGVPFTNSDEVLPSAAPGYYTEWTAAASRAKRGTHRMIVGGNPTNPDVVYYWDHRANYVRVLP